MEHARSLEEVWRCYEQKPSGDEYIAQQSDGNSGNDDDIVVVVDLSDIEKICNDEPDLPTIELDCLYVEMYLRYSKDSSPQLVARLGDGTETTDVVPHIASYVDEMDEQNMQMPRVVASAILLQTPYMFEHYGAEQAQNLIDRVIRAAELKPYIPKDSQR
ncbi:hypothetical protein KY349_03140 [Candidatus Woesearchaeota archaeon]|jgi:hypothetical protein|nr:hypothetical protein [Candidatus Woesearchaeota archaeon]